MGLGRIWEYGGEYNFGESNKKRRNKIQKHTEELKKPRKYYECMSSIELSQSMRGKRDSCIQLLENFGSIKIELAAGGITVGNKNQPKNSKNSKNSGGKKQ